MRLRARLVPLVLVPLAFAGTVSCAGLDATPGNAAGSTSSNATSTGNDTAPVGDDAATDHRTVAARVTVKAASVHAEPSETSRTITTVKDTTELGSRTTMLVSGAQDDWVKVDLPVRPNGSTGWIRKSHVELRTNTVAITVDRASHQLVVTRDGEVVAQSEVAVGSAENPTPAGSFYVTDLVDTGNAGGSYGPYALGLSGHSETLSEFAGGDGQLGIHGTNDPSSIGRSVSHGCVRVPNDVIRQLKDLVPLGTPVTVA